MKNTKRIFAGILLVCMLLSVLPLGAFATPVYSWTGNALKESTEVTRFAHSDVSFTTKYDGYLRLILDNKTEEGSSFQALKFTSIAADTYTVKIDAMKINQNYEYTFHVFPSSLIPEGTNASDTNTAVSNIISSGSYQVGNYSASKGASNVSISFAAEMTAGSVLAIAGPAAGGVKTYMDITNISLTEGGSAPKPTTPAPSEPAATTPTVPAATEPATQPSSGSNTGNTSISMEVGWEVAAEDAVSQSYYTHAATGVVNGHDYLYLGLRGGKLVIYDIDEKKQINSINTGNDAPLYILVDENGIAWITSGKGMLRYDPFTNTSEEVVIDFSLFDKTTVAVLGMVSDGNGKIYFGSHNHGYIGCYDTATKKTYRISDWLELPGHEGDCKQAGYGGLAYKDGYLYLGIDGDLNADGKKLHYLIKYDIANRKIVDSLDVSFAFEDDNKYFQYMKIVDNILFPSFGGGNPKKVSLFVDVSGNKMKFTDIPNLNAGHSGGVTEKVDGKIYFSSYFGEGNPKGIVEYDLTTNTTAQLWKGNQVLRSEGNHFVTIEGDDRLPGKSIVIPVNDEVNGVINLLFFNPQTKQMVEFNANIGLTGGAGANVRGLTTDDTGRYIYIGAWANNAIAKYDTVEGRVVDTFRSFSHQTDDLEYWDGYLYAGNYSAGTITRINPETYEAQPLFSLRYSVFEQCRMHSLAFGGNKVFCGTVPYTGFGGTLVWYDFDKNLTYVAAGPYPEDVFYADTSGLTNDTVLDKLQYTWYNAVTGEAMDFDDDDDGRDDVYLADGNRRFNGAIPGQVINNLIYKDGYLYGTSSIAGSSGTIPNDTSQALLFVYDVAAMKVIATCDLADHLEGFTNQIPYLDQLAADPDVDGKFWGVIDDTLYTMTFNIASKTFHIKEEFSIKKEQYYSAPTGSYSHRDMCFAGEYLYVGFGRHSGTYMVRKIDTSERYFINEFSPNCMVLAADGNLYWTSNESSKLPHNLNMFPVGEKAAPLLAKGPLDTAQKLIDALPDKITKDDKAAIDAARKAYDKLTDEEKAKITNLDKLLAAEKAYANLPVITALIIAGAAVAVIAVAVVVLLILKKKKKKNISDAE